MGEIVSKLSEEMLHELEDVIEHLSKYEEAIAKGEWMRILKEISKLGFHWKRLEELSKLAMIWREN